MIERTITFSKEPFVILTGKNPKCRDIGLSVLNHKKFLYCSFFPHYTIPHKPTHDVRCRSKSFQSKLALDCLKPVFLK